MDTVSYDQLIATREVREAELWKVYGPDVARQIKQRLDQEELLQRRRELAAEIYALLGRETIRRIPCQHHIDVKEKPSGSWKGGPHKRVPVAVHPLLGISDNGSGWFCLYYFGNGLLYESGFLLATPNRVLGDVLPQYELGRRNAVPTERLELILEELQKLAAV
ncbi:MAG: hypothetical protein EPO30_11125 [Lysobacteraceae bacterium]|nr:MAG: hypothetical protein EPO30_11125 [Xanthomonadaceae bacterium]